MVTLRTQDDVKLLNQIESGFKRKTNWNKYHSQKSSEAQNRYLSILIDPCFQGVNRFFDLSFEGDDSRRSYKQYHLPTVKIKYYNVR